MIRRTTSLKAWRWMLGLSVLAVGVMLGGCGDESGRGPFSQEFEKPELPPGAPVVNPDQELDDDPTLPTDYREREIELYRRAEEKAAAKKGR